MSAPLSTVISDASSSYSTSSSSTSSTPPNVSSWWPAEFMGTSQQQCDRDDERICIPSVDTSSNTFRGTISFGRYSDSGEFSFGPTLPLTECYYNHQSRAIRFTRPAQYGDESDIQYVGRVEYNPHYRAYVLEGKRASPPGTDTYGWVQFVRKGECTVESENDEESQSPKSPSMLSPTSRQKASSSSSSSSSPLNGRDYILALPFDCAYLPADHTHVTYWTDRVFAKPIQKFGQELVQLVSQYGSTFSQSEEEDAITRLFLDSTPLPTDLIHLILDYRLTLHLPIWLGPSGGALHMDSETFLAFPTKRTGSADTNPIASPKQALTKLLSGGWSIRQIIGHGQRWCCGVQFVYGPTITDYDMFAPTAIDASGRVTVNEGDVITNESDLEGVRGYYTTEKRVGNHEKAHRTFFRLECDEYITAIELRSGEWVDSITFTLNTGRSFRIGSSAGGGQNEWHAPPHGALIGLFGAVGGHLHSISPIFASTITPEKRKSIEKAKQREKDESEGSSSHHTTVPRNLHWTSITDTK